jgi:O-acetyl-ADP-ribose deacetylase (regulator of RNase III)
MNQFQEINYNLIKFAQEGKCDVVVHGCNCFNTMGAGIAVAMKKAFGCDRYLMEKAGKGDINKLGQIEYEYHTTNNGKAVAVVNAYTQFHYHHESPEGIPLDIYALQMVFRKLNMAFRGKHIAMPKIGCGLAGGNWEEVKHLIIKLIPDCKVTICYI